MAEWITHDVGIDYLRLTAKRDTPEYVFLLDTMMKEHQTEKKAGHKNHCFNFKGYEGQLCGKVGYARREDGCMVQASSSKADELVEKFRGYDGELRCTRIDTQVTGKTDRDVDQLIREARDSIEARNSSPTQKRSIAVGFNSTPSGGSQFTVGVRTSERYARFYNKTAEQRGGIENGLGRFEVEFKGKQARALWRNIERSGLHTLIAADVTVAFFGMKGLDLSWVDHRPGKCLPSSYQPTSVEKQLKWLEKNVGSVIRNLCLQGYEDDVKRILQLPELWK